MLHSRFSFKTSGGSVFLFDRKVLRYFRKDGHNWRKKKDGKTVKEAHEKLKVSMGKRRPFRVNGIFTPEIWFCNEVESSKSFLVFTRALILASSYIFQVGSVDMLHCYYAHGEENENFQRRSYWMLEQ